MHDWTGWRHHFEAQALRALPAVDLPPLSDEQRAALVHSLAVFQLGESGEGRIAHQIDRVDLHNTNGDFRRALKLFVREEGRHGRILGQMLRELGGRELDSNWTETLFRHGRRLMGVRLKLLVLMSAEVVGQTCYRLLLDELPESGLRSALIQICQDEEHHLAFHADFFRANLRTPQERAAWKAAWWSVNLAALSVVARDHAATLETFGIPRRALMQRGLEAARLGEELVLGRGPEPRRQAA